VRSTRSDSPRNLIWLAALVILALGGGAVAWLLRGTGNAEPAAKPAPTVAKQEEAPAPVLPDAPATAEARNIDVTELPPTRPRPVVVAQVGGPTGDIEGVAVNIHGQPVANVHITAYMGNPLLPGMGARDTVDSSAITAGDGVFKLKNVPAGKAYVVRGEHDDYAISERSGINVEADRVTPGVKLRMADGAVIRGQVNAAGGGPIYGARAELYSTLDLVLQKPDEQKPWKVVFSDGQGRFAFTHVSTPSIRVRVSADGYESQTRTTSNALDGEARDQDLTFELNAGQSLRGRAVDDNLAPVAKARVEATSLTKDFQSTAVAFSDASGYFILDGVGSNAYQVRATCEGYSDATLPHVDPADGDLQIVLSKRGGVEGFVANGKGGAVPRFTLHLMRSRAGSDPNYMNDSRPFEDPQGHFLFDNLDPGDYQLEARADDFADARSSVFTIVRNEPSPPSIKIVMTRGGTLEGVVKGPDGKAVSGATVSLNTNNYIDSSIAKIFAAIAPSDDRERKVRSSDGGKFIFEHVPAGTYQVAAEHAEYASRVVNDVAIADDDAGGNAPIEVKLPPGAGIAGRALDTTQAPLSFCKVQISQKDTAFMDTGSTDADGYFSFKNLSQGQYVVTINPETVNGEPVHPFLRLVYAQKSSKDIYVGEGQTVDGLLLQLKTN